MRFSLALAVAVSLPASPALAQTEAAPAAAAPAAPPVPQIGEALTVDATNGATTAVGEDPAREAKDLSIQRPEDRPWQLVGEVSYRTLLVRDEDPANDQRMVYRLQFGYEAL